MKHLATLMESPKNPLNIKYLKLINHIATQRKEWSHKEDIEIGKEFDLGWIINDGNKQTITLENVKMMVRRKEKDAKKPSKTDRILLCQNNSSHGHRATHVVEIIDEPHEAKRENDFIWTRRVKTVWAATSIDKAPRTEDVIGKKFSFRSGNLVSVNAPTIELNLDMLKNI
jgi:hypothetical protein